MPLQLIELMVAGHKRRRGLPVDFAKLRGDRAKFIRALWPDYNERITGIVSPLPARKQEI